MTFRIATVRCVTWLLPIAAAALLAHDPPGVRADRYRGGGGGGAARSHVHSANRNTSANRNANVNRNVNVNQNVNVNRNVNVHGGYGYHGGYYGGYDRWGHPVAAAVAVTATAVAIGTMVASLPPQCTATVIGGVTYQSCGGTYYKPMYQGSTVQYVVVAPP
jgi:hypothetical protein